MEPYDWIKNIVVLHTDSDIKPQGATTSDKILHTYKDFGSRFGKQPEDGGYHEVAARNHSLDLARDTGCEWALICDADEFFTHEAWPAIHEAHRTKKDVVWYSCYHYCDPFHYLWWANQVRRVQGSKHLMHDAHARAIRLGGRKLSYVMNNNMQFRDTLGNRTQHCHLMGHPAHCCYHGYGKVHIHTRHMFEPKRPKESWFKGRDIRESTLQMPAEILAAWNSQASTNVGGI